MDCVCGGCSIFCESDSRQGAEVDVDTSVNWVSGTPVKTVESKKSRTTSSPSLWTSAIIPNPFAGWSCPRSLTGCREKLAAGTLYSFLRFLLLWATRRRDLE